MITRYFKMSSVFLSRLVFSRGKFLSVWQYWMDQVSSSLSILWREYAVSTVPQTNIGLSDIYRCAENPAFWARMVIISVSFLVFTRQFLCENVQRKHDSNDWSVLWKIIKIFTIHLDVLYFYEKFLQRRV